MQVNNFYKNITLILIAFCFAVIPLYDFIFIGPFKWHIQQPAVTQGALELGIMLFIFYGILKYFNKIKLVGTFAITILILLYLRRHNVDISLLITFVYINSLYFLGSILVSRIDISYKHSFSFLVGISIWVLYSLWLSLFNLATIKVLVATAIFIFLISLFLKKHSIINILMIKLKLLYDSEKVNNPFYISIFIVLFLILFVQSSQQPSYDEFWYSLRGQEVLNINGSFFEPILMLQHWVSFYPKLYEILIYPLEYFNTFTTSRIFTVFVLLFFCIAMYEFLSSKMTKENSLLVIFSIITIPAIANSSIISKPDLISVFIVVMGLFYFIKYTETKLLSYFILSVILLIFSLTTKLSVVAYIGIMGVLFLGYFFLYISATKKDVNIYHYLFYSLFLLVFIGVTYRTIYIVGIPFVSLNEISPFIDKIYTLFGFEYHELYQKINTAKSLFIYNSLELFIKYNFYPIETRLIFAWISNLYTILFGLFIIFFLRDKLKINIYRTLLITISIVFFFVLYILMGKGDRIIGGDGNYHLIPVISMILLISLENQIVKFYKFLIPIILTNIILLFITNYGWSIGTNKFDLNFTKNPFNREEIRILNLKKIGAEDIYYRLKKSNLQNKVIGMGPEQELYLLKASYESAQQIAMQRPYLLTSTKTFIEFLTKSKTTHILYPKYIPDNKFVTYAEAMRKCSFVKSYIGDKYILLNIRNLTMQCVEKLNQPILTNKKNKVLYNFITPTNIIHPKYNNHFWLKPFTILNNKYYPTNTLGLRNGTTISYEIDMTNYPLKDLYFTTKVMINIFANIKTNNFLDIVVRDSTGGDVVVKKHIKFEKKSIKDIEIYLNNLKNIKYTIEFIYDVKNGDRQIVLLNTSLYQKLGDK